MATVLVIIHGLVAVALLGAIVYTSDAGSLRSRLAQKPGSIFWSLPVRCNPPRSPTPLSFST